MCDIRVGFIVRRKSSVLKLDSHNNVENTCF